MTDKHPLTDEMCEEIQLHAFSQSDEDCMRGAADWQLKQVTKWLKSNTADYVGAGCYFLTESFLDDFKKAMRPTTTQEESDD